MADKKPFEPFTILGVFWLAFGIVVLVATLFVRGTARVPRTHGIITNLIAAAILLAAGIGSLIKGRADTRKKGNGS